jgi:adenylate cyclase
MANRFRGAVRVTVLILYALVVIATGAAVSFLVYADRSGKLSRLFLALPRKTRKALLRRPSLLKLRGETRTITYLSCRIANAAEIEQAFRAHPAQLIRLFEKRLRALYEAVLAQGGTVERFGSAGFAAYWNAPLDDPEHAARALAAAVRMMGVIRTENAMKALRQEIASPPLHLAIGLATGPATAGLFGGAYSVSGACVPRAEELRAACAEYGFTALTDLETAARAEQFALLEIERPARKDGSAATETVSIHALMGDHGVRASPTFRALSTYHDRIFAALYAQDHEEAATLIAEASHLSGASAKLYEIYRRRDLREPFRQAS